MMLLWMCSAILFTALIAVAAYFAERTLRAADRQARGVWMFALAAGTVWPVLVPLLRRVRPAAPMVGGNATLLDAIYIIPERVTGIGEWMPLVNRLVLAAWLVASLLLLARYSLRWQAVRRLRRAAEPAIVDGIEVLVSHDLGPAVVGLRNVAVLIPRSMLELDAPLRRLVLRHEEEHRRAGDTWVLLCLALAVAMMPWNIPLWWIARRARLALEVDCDARVMAAGESVTRYVQVLLLAAQRVSAAPLTPMLVASRTHLERRIVAMQNKSSRNRTLRIAGGTAACLVAVFAACSSPISDETSTSRASNTAEASPDKMPVYGKQPTKVAEPYFEFQVEKQVTTMPGSPQPTYPAELKQAKVEGEVLAQFVVDTSGRAIVSTFKVLKSDHQLFTDAVKNVLPDMRFTPAEIGGRKVKQLIQQPFTFALSKSAIAGDVQIPNPAARPRR
jgi:TonB family protein